MKNILLSLTLISALFIGSCGGGGGGGASTANNCPAGQYGTLPNCVTVPVQKVPATGQTTVYQTGDNGTYSNINPMSYTDNGNGTVTDNVTGLLWEQATNALPNNTNLNNCTVLNVGGKTNWSYPSVANLQSIVNYGAYLPAINSTYFPSTQSSDYWTNEYSGNVGWAVSFVDGYLSNPQTGYIRCVRGTKTYPSGFIFNDNGDGTATDMVTTLMWQQQDDGAQKTWANAITYCTGLSLGGHADWRLANVKELTSIAYYKSSNPAINTKIFPSTPSTSTAFYWTSTTISNDGATACAVNFSNGGAGGRAKTGSSYARCVRLGQ